MVHRLRSVLQRNVVALGWLWQWHASLRAFGSFMWPQRCHMVRRLDILPLFPTIAYGSLQVVRCTIFVDLNGVPLL